MMIIFDCKVLIKAFVEKWRINAKGWTIFPPYKMKARHVPGFH